MSNKKNPEVQKNDLIPNADYIFIEYEPWEQGEGGVGIVPVGVPQRIRVGIKTFHTREARAVRSYDVVPVPSDSLEVLIEAASIRIEPHSPEKGLQQSEVFLDFICRAAGPATLELVFFSERCYQGYLEIKLEAVDPAANR
jgi:hypothetical protein